MECGSCCSVSIKNAKWTYTVFSLDNGFTPNMRNFAYVLGSTLRLNKQEINIRLFLLSSISDDASFALLVLLVQNIFLCGCQGTDE